MVEKCYECKGEIDFENDYIEAIDEYGSFYFHCRCFVESDFIRDDDLIARGFADAIDSKN